MLKANALLNPASKDVKHSGLCWAYACLQTRNMSCILHPLCCGSLGSDDDCLLSLKKETHQMAAKSRIDARYSAVAPKIRMGKRVLTAVVKMSEATTFHISRLLPPCHRTLVVPLQPLERREEVEARFAPDMQSFSNICSESDRRVAVKDTDMAEIAKKPDSSAGDVGNGSL